MKLSPEAIELRTIVDELGDVQLTASQLRQMTDKRFNLEQCRCALEYAGKLVRVGRYKIMYPDAEAYVRESPTKIKTSYIREKFGISASAALGILKRHNRLDRVYTIKPRGDKPLILNLANGQQITARELSQRAKDAGINVDTKLCRKILLDNGLLKLDKLGTCKYPHVYDYVKNNPPISAADLAKKFGLSNKVAHSILSHCKKRGYERGYERGYKKTLIDKANELPEPITVKEFQEMIGCLRSTAYNALIRAGKFKKKTSKPKPQNAPPPPRRTKVVAATKPVIEPPPLPPPPKPRPQQTRIIASMFEAWKEKNL